MLFNSLRLQYGYCKYFFCGAGVDVATVTVAAAAVLISFVFHKLILICLCLWCLSVLNFIPYAFIECPQTAAHCYTYLIYGNWRSFCLSSLLSRFDEIYSIFMCIVHILISELKKSAQHNTTTAMRAICGASF